MQKPYNRFYILSVAVLLLLSAYPVVNGVRMGTLSLRNGSIDPEQYAKYVVPYAAICVSLILFAAAQPLFFKLKRLAFPVGWVVSTGIFFAVETFFERIQIHTTGMTLIDAATLTTDAANPATTADLWQASLCIASPPMREQSLTYASTDSYYYVIGNDTYKIHYYLIALILITMVGGLVYGIGKMLRAGDHTQKKPLMLRGLSTAVLLTLCVFANTTAFFRQAAPIQTPLASVLTCVFFVLLGAAAGVYAGSYLTGMRRALGLVLPVLISISVTTAMYVGEAVMMGGSLYRFGVGWFFDPVIVLAPADILVVLLSGTVTALVLGSARKWERWPGKPALLSTVILCAAVALSGVAFSSAASPRTESPDDDILGCYEFDECLYMNPLSSFAAFGKLPYVYGLTDDSLIIANTESGQLETYSVTYEKTPVPTDEFTSKIEFSFLPSPDLSGYGERWLRAVISGQYGPGLGLYQMDGEIWLVDIREKAGLWSIYRLERTDTTTMADLKRALTAHTDAVQMTLKDVYALARKGEALTLEDFEPFYYQLTGPDFTVRRYDVAGADTLFVRTGDNGLESAQLQSRRTLDPSNVVDLREGFAAVASYQNPLKPWDDITIEDSGSNEGVDGLIYEYDYDECRYYLNGRNGDLISAVFSDGERMPLKQALEERRITVEDIYPHGLGNISMIPIENPLGGMFPILHHLHTFELDGEAFYPEKSFMYETDDLSAYFNYHELIDILDWYGHDGKVKELQYMDTSNLTVIAGRPYIRDTDLAELGIETDIGWVYSSHTPVRFTIVN